MTTYLITLFVSDILWDTDGLLCPGLPVSLEVTVMCGDPLCLENCISGFLSDNFGFCHHGFSMDETDRTEVVGSPDFYVCDYTILD